MEMNEGERQSLEVVLERARQAIQRAKSLSAHFSLTSPVGVTEGAEPSGSGDNGAYNDGDEGLPGGVPMQPGSGRSNEHTPAAASNDSSATDVHIEQEPRRCNPVDGQTHDGDVTECQGSGTTEDATYHLGISQEQVEESPRSIARPLLDVARRLALLQQQQQSTLSHLLNLRLEQLRLRQQQLGALQELLRAEAEAVEGTPMQLAAVHQALQLLSQSLEDMDLAATAITASRALDSVAMVAATVSRADARAEDISRMARQLLGVLREFPRRQGLGRASGESLGASEAELALLPTTQCGDGHALLGELCAICLAEFAPGDHLTGIPGCPHQHHTACLHEWLRIKACCPLCKHPLAAHRENGAAEDAGSQASTAAGS